MIDQNLLYESAVTNNMDETGFQLNSEAEKFVTKKGSKHVHHIFSTEKVQTIAVDAYYNVEGNFLTSFCTFQGK